VYATCIKIYLFLLKIGEHCTTGYILMLKKVGIFVKYAKKFCNIQGALKISQETFIYTPFTYYQKATGKTGKLTKQRMGL